MKHLLAIVLVAVFATATFADDVGKPAKQSFLATKLGETLKPITLTEEQETGLAEAIKTFEAKKTELAGKGLTEEKIVARNAKRKAGMESGAKGKDMKALVNEGLSEEEIGMFKELEKSTKDAERTVAKMLTPEQMSELSEKNQKYMAKLLKERKGKKGEKGGKGKKKKKKKKKEAAAE